MRLRTTPRPDRGRRGGRAGVRRDGHRRRRTRRLAVRRHARRRALRLVCRGCRSSATDPSAACAPASCATAMSSTRGTRSSPAAHARACASCCERGLARPARRRRSTARASRSTTCQLDVPVPDPGQDRLHRPQLPRARGGGRHRPARPPRRSSRSSATRSSPTGAEVTLPAASEKVDYEAEVAFVIGRRCQRRRRGTTRSTTSPATCCSTTSRRATSSSPRRSGCPARSSTARRRAAPRS